MALLRNNKLNQLDSAVTEVTEGMSFVSWAESIAQRLVDKSSTLKNEVNLNHLLSLRNIIVHEMTDKETSHLYKANLVNNIKHYDLYIDLPQIKTGNEKKFILAHEIAHTLFYSDSDKGLKKNISQSFGSNQIENICDYIAICLLLPKRFIDDEISEYKVEKDTLRKRNENYLKLVFHLAAKYQVDWHYVLYRLIGNFSFLPNSLCIEFSKQDKWYLRWAFQTDSLNKKNLFIPIKSKSESRYVSAKKSFVQVLQRISNETSLKPNTYGSIIIEKSMFDSYYQGNFKQFLSKNFTSDLDIIKIYYRVNRNDSIVALFPFDGLLRT